MTGPGPGRPGDSRRWNTRFALFVHSVGVRELAVKLGRDRTTVYQWVSGANVPSVLDIGKILNIAKARKATLSFSDINRHIRAVRKIRAAEREANPCSPNP